MPAANLKLVSTAKIMINGADVPDADMLNVVEVRVDQAVASTNRAVMRFVDDDFQLVDSSKFALANTVTIEFTTGNTSRKVFSGEITAVASEQGRNNRHELVVEAYDRSHRLAREAMPKTYVNMTYAEIIHKIVSVYDLTVQISGSALNRVHEYVLKTGTNFEFFDEIALRTGAYWYVDADGTMHFLERTDGTEVATVEFGKDLIRFKARFSDNGHASKVSVRSWDYAAKQAIVSDDTSELASPTGGSAIGMQAGQRNKFDAGSNTLVVSTTGAATANEATDLAKSIGRRQAMNELTARGEAFGNPVIQAGKTIKLKGVGTKMSGKYYLTQVEHIFGPSDLITRFTAGGLQNNTIVDLVRGESSATLTPFSRSQVVVGIVTNNKDDDQHIGRVKVKFPSLSDADNSAWARVLSPGAGADRGMHFTPNVDDEVLVAFEQGDLRRPIVLGGLWNGTAKPWGTNDTTVDGSSKSIQWGIKSRTGHQFLINEDAGDDKNFVKVLLQDGTILHVGHDKIELISKSGKPVEVKTGDADLVMKDGNVTLKGKNITIEASGNLTLKATGNIDAKATGNAKIEATANLELTGTAGAKVSSPVTLQLKGAMTMIN